MHVWPLCFSFLYTGKNPYLIWFWVHVHCYVMCLTKYILFVLVCLMWPVKKLWHTAVQYLSSFYINLLLFSSYILSDQRKFFLFLCKYRLACWYLLSILCSYKVHRWIWAVERQHSCLKVWCCYTCALQGEHDCMYNGKVSAHCV